MFREMRRFRQQLEQNECEQILTEEKRCVLSVLGVDGYPYGIPMDFYYDKDDNRLYFHCAKVGHKIDAIERNPKVCVTIWNTGFQKEGDWAWNVSSVVVFGKAVLIDDTKLSEEKVRALALKYYPTKEEVEEELASSLSRVQLIAVEIEHMTGKLVNEK